MKNIIVLNGSPRMKGSISMKMLDLFQEHLGTDCKVQVIEAGKSILHQNQWKDYGYMVEADAMVIAFPLYVYCLPGVLMEFLVGYQDYIRGKGQTPEQKVYAIINCGFPEARINEDAAHVIKCFCKKIHAQYRFSILIGGGGMLRPLKMMPSVNKMWKKIEFAFGQIIGDVRDEKKIEDIYIDVKLQKKLFNFIAETNFTVIAKTKGVKKKELFKQPYLLKGEI